MKNIETRNCKEEKETAKCYPLRKMKTYYTVL